MLSTSSAIIEEIKVIQKAGLALFAYFDFDFKDSSKRDIRGLLVYFGSDFRPIGPIVDHSFSVVYRPSRRLRSAK
jgi:hypothetical protein